MGGLCGVFCWFHTVVLLTLRQPVFSYILAAWEIGANNDSSAGPKGHDLRLNNHSAGSTAGNFKLDNNRNGTMRSAIFLLTFTIVHALGNFVDMLGGPDELNGEGYLFDRIHWTGALGMAKDA